MYQYIRVSSQDFDVWNFEFKPIENVSAQAVLVKQKKKNEHLIKVFALAGAALETFLFVDPESWRQEGPKEKWIKKEEDKNG